MHYEQNVSEADRAHFDEALRNLGETVQLRRAVEDAARDPAVYEDVNRLASSLGDALSEIFA